jgi:hypothetical protein
MRHEQPTGFRRRSSVSRTPERTAEPTAKSSTDTFESAFGKHLGQVAQAQPVGDVPADGQHDRSPPDGDGIGTSDHGGDDGASGASLKERNPTNPPFPQQIPKEYLRTCVSFGTPNPMLYGS